MSAILFDLDGVLYENDRAIDGAADSVNWCSENNIRHLFLTNTTSKSRAALVDKLASFGIETEAADFLTPPVAACQWLHKHKLSKIAVFAPESTRQEFSEFTLLDTVDDTNIDSVIVGDLGDKWSFALMNQVFNLLINNPQAKLIALGMTRYWRSSSGLQLDVGPMIKAFEYATGMKATVTGKPAAAFFHAALTLLGSNDAVMIGDDIHGDIEAAQKIGLKAILVKTGKFDNHDLATGITPDAILDSVASLPTWWQRYIS